MPNFRSRPEEAPSEELLEFPITGPFGGVQSEMPNSMVEKYGFVDLQNVLCRLGQMQARPTYQTLAFASSQLVGPPLGMGDFYDINGKRNQYLFMTDGGTGNLDVLYYNESALQFQDLTGPNLGPAIAVARAVVNQELLFAPVAAPGVPSAQIQVYNAQTTTYALVSANAPSATVLFELGYHLMAANYIPSGGGQQQTQGYIWSGVGDPTDWLSFSSGSNNLLNDLGPTVGGQKLGQYGFGYHNKGIVQIIPTGLGAAPFAFYPIVNTRMCGLFCPYSLDKVIIGGVECGIYVGADNVYIWNQTSSIPIGDAPVSGSRTRVGARQRIFADIRNSLIAFGPFSGMNTVFGFVTTQLNGVPFNAYWLFCPSVTTNICWVYNFDEGNWTRLVFDQRPTCAGPFVFSNSVLASLEGDPQETIGIGFFNGASSVGSVGYIDFTQPPSETTMYVTSGQHIFNDRRHKSTVKKFRLVATDNGAVTYTITLTNESGVTVTQEIATGGDGDGEDRSYIVPFTITGLRIKWQLSAPNGSPLSIVEFAPIYDVGGEQRSGTVDGN
jgi:hypothetical protein